MMAALADGDRSQFNRNYQIAWPIVNRFATKLLGSTPEAEDVAQQSLLNIFSRASEYDSAKDALPWIMSITFYECRTHRRKIFRRREDELGSGSYEQPDLSASADEALIRKELNDAVNQTIESLDRIDRETILTSILELARPDIAPATFRKRLQRAMTKFKSSWRTSYEHEPQ